jgi:stearoyl-CoA desaturase (delta-9 desaturase)
VHRPPIIALVIVPFLATLFGIYQVFTGSIGLTEISLLVIGVLLTEYGVTFGYHRMVVHKSFEPRPILKAIVLALGSMSFQGSVINWASVHTKHHAHSDQEGDPHSPTLSGFIHAHFEWLLEMHDSELESIKEKWGARYAKDPMIAWFSSTFLLWSAVGLILPASIGFLTNGWEGALTWFIWGGLMRVFITSHVTWSVNSVCHYIGRKMFVTTDHSRNNFLIGLLALGEGWHNNHHAFPASAFHGLRWWQIDLTGLSIRIYERLGLVRKVVRIPASLLEKRRLESKRTALKVQSLALTEEL